MNKFIFKKIKIKNFKGIANYELDFNEDKIEIASETGNGKSSIFEAIKWCLGFNVSNFEPKIDTYRIKDIVSSVELTIEKNGIEHILGITNEQVYKTNKETGERYFNSNKSTYQFNGLDCGQKDYKSKISALFEMTLDELNILLDIKHFNRNEASKWTWVDRRKFLKEKMNIDTLIHSLAEKKEYNLLKEYLLKGKDEIDIQKQLSQEKTLYEKGDAKKKENGLLQYKALIDEKIKEITELKKIDFENLDKRKIEIQKEIDNIITNDSSQNGNNIVKEKQKEISNIKIEIMNIRNEFYSRLNDYNSKINELNLKIKNIENRIADGKKFISTLNNNIETNKIDIEILENETFDKENQVCKYCNQKLPQDMVAELETKFNNDKYLKLNNLKNELENSLLKLSKAEERMNELEKDKNALQDDLKALQDGKPILDEERIKNLNVNIEMLNNEIKNINSSDIQNTINDKIKELRVEQEEIIKGLGKKEDLEKCNKQLEDLKNKQKEISNKEIVRVKKQQQLRYYIKECVEIINKEIKKYFNEHLKFNFFIWNSDNAENEFDMCCNILYDGVEYNNLSQGQKIICDTLFIRDLQKLLDVNFPLIVDNRQDNTFDIENNSQLIELLTIKGKKLNGLTRINEVYTLDDCDIKE